MSPHGELPCMYYEFQGDGLFVRDKARFDIAVELAGFYCRNPECFTRCYVKSTRYRVL